MADFSRPDRPIFCGNYEYDATEREIVKLFEKYGDVTRIDMKTGFAFVYMRDKREGDEAIRKLDGYEFGYKRRRLRVEWAKQKESDRKRDCKPSSTLFVVNFDVTRVRERDVERYFEPYGRLKRVEIKRNYAFVQFENIDDAVYAMDRTNGTQMAGRTITVEYTQNEDPWAREGRAGTHSPHNSPRRGRSRSRTPPRRDRSPSYERGRGRSRSRSPPPRAASPPPRRASPPPRRDSPPPRRDSPPPRRDRSYSR